MATRVQIVRIEPGHDRWIFAAHGARFEMKQAKELARMMRARGCKVQFLTCLPED